MILLLTGQPGAGKTAYGLVRAFDLKKEGREVYAHGVKNLDYERAGFHRIEDPSKWQDLPDGAVIVLDECYGTFPNRNPGSKVPDHVEAMARHRHRGFDFILISQQGLQLDPFLRGLYEEHVHVKKKLGKFTRLRRWSSYQSNVNGHCADVNDWVRPKWVFDYFTSTVKDTSKWHIPTWVRNLLVMAGLAVGLAWALASSWGSDIDEMRSASAGTAGAVASRGGTTTGAAAPGPKWANRHDYAAAHLPRFDTMPQTAPIFDQRDPQSEPELYCLSSGRNGIDSCSCMTEQGTRYDLALPQCRHIARWGQPYNPYKAPRDVDRSMSSPAAMQPVPVSRSLRPAVGAGGFNRQVGGSYFPPEKTPVAALSDRY